MSYGNYIASMKKLITKQTAGILAGIVLLMALAAIAIPRAEAQSGIVYMKIYNSKTGTRRY